jgi:hypothetical protein
MKTWWLCYRCLEYHSSEGYPNRIDRSQRSISYDSSLCLLWATGLAFPLDKTKNARTVAKEKELSADETN